MSVTQTFRCSLLAAGSASAPLLIGILLLTAPGAAVAQEDNATTAGQGAASEAAPEPGTPSAPQGQGEAEAAPAQAAPQSQAAPFVDDRPLPPPPPSGSSQGYPASGQYQAPPPDGVYRPFSFTLGAGPGFVRLNTGPDADTIAGISYALRFGFGVQPNLNLTLAFEGASASKRGTLASQDAFLIGLQYFATQVFYVRGALGIANETEKDEDEIFVDQSGLGLQGAIGVDLVQGSNVALSLEAVALLGRYPDETWTSGGLNLLFSLY